MRDDAVQPETRWTARMVAPFLLLGGGILYLFPARTDRLWAWTVRPTMTAVVMGASYLGGALFFVRAARAARWHTLGVGLLGADLLATLLLIATVVHWDRFHHGNPAFWVWTALYAVTPLLLPVLWLRNRARDPHTVEPGDVLVPRPLRVGIGCLGVVQLVLAVATFVRPALSVRVWPWALTPLTARTLSAFFAFLAVVWVAFLFEARWSALRLHLEGATLALVLVAVGALRARHDFIHRPVPGWGFGLLLAGVLALLCGVQVAMRSVARRPTPTPAAWPT